MKKITLTLLLAFCILNISAQEKITYTAKIGSGIPMSTPHITPLTVEGMAHYNLTSHWAFGAGTGYGLYDDISSIPLYANIKYTIRPYATYNLFADCSVGYGFALGNKNNGGFYMNPEFGIQRKIWNKTFSIAVGYQWQDLERRKSHNDKYVSSQFVECLSVQSVSFKLGIMF
jgi:hypothetical protein